LSSTQIPYQALRSLTVFQGLRTTLTKRHADSSAVSPHDVFI